MALISPSVVGPRVRAVIRPHLRLAPVIVLLGLIAAALEGVSIGLMMPLLNIMIGGGASATGLPGVLSRVGDSYPVGTRVLVISAGIVLLILLKNVVAFANSVMTAWVFGRAGHAIRNGLTERLTKVGYPFFLKEPPGRLLNTLSNESWRASEAIAIGLGMAVSAAAALILLLFLFGLSWRLSAAVLVGLALIQGVQALISHRLRAMSGEVTQENAELASRMLHLVDGSRVIRLFGREAAERQQFSLVSDGLRRMALRLEVRKAAIAPTTELLQSVLFVVVVVTSWRAGIDFSIIAAFVVLLYRMQPHVKSLQSSTAQLQGLAGSLAAVERLLDEASQPPAPSGHAPAAAPARSIRFSDVSYRFPGENMPPVLDRASFEFRANRATALVGRSGAGKTTAVNLLCRFLDPDEGCILIDDVPLNEVDPEQWRRRLALASQDLELCEGSIFENIAYGVEHASPEEVVRAAEIADADRFIRGLPNGYDTVTGYRGVNLSAGQRQRIGLARALLRDPDILILDEATNAVDGISELSIIETLKARSGRRTTIVISHHRSTLTFCDDVVILGGGRAIANMELAEVEGSDMESLYRYVAPPAS